MSLTIGRPGQASAVADSTVARSRSLTFYSIVIVLTIWMWGLAGVLFWIRWSSVERPLASTKQLFPYGEIRIGVDASYPPFAVATSTDMYGIDIDIGNAIGKRPGLGVGRAGA